MPTRGPETAGPIAREQVERGADLIIGAGGDGTVNEILQGLVHSDVPLAVLPGGTANVLAMEMKLGKSIDRVARQLGDWRSHRISVGHVKCGEKTSRYFLLMAGIGLDARIVYQVSAALKARTGKFAYWVAGWSLVGRSLPQMQVEIDGNRRQCSFALVSKVRNYGGDFEIARSVSLFDDDFEAVLFEGKTSLPYIKYFAGMALNRLAGMNGVTVLRAGSVRLTSPGDSRIYVQVDGEFAGRLPAEISIVPNAVSLLIPPDYETCHSATHRTATVRDRPEQRTTSRTS